MKNKKNELEQDIETRGKIFQTLKSGDEISIPIIKRFYAVGHFTASRVFDTLKQDGLIEKIEDSQMYRMK